MNEYFNLLVPISLLSVCQEYNRMENSKTSGKII